MKATTTKTEKKIIDHVRSCNDAGALAGLGLNEERFAKRLADAGRLVYVTWSKSLGSGWAVADHKIVAQ